MENTRLTILGSSQLSTIAGQVDSLLAPWSNDWLHGRKAARITEVFQYSPDKSKHLEFVNTIVVSKSKSEWGAYLNSGESYHILMSILLGSSTVDHESKLPQTSLANGLLEQALQELFTVISGCTETTIEVRATSDFPIDCTRLGTNSVVLKIQVCGVYLHLLLSPEIVRSIGIPEFVDTQKNNRPKLTPVISALVDQRVKCRVSLGFAELKLSELLNLQLGDVITLDQTLESPAIMSINGVEVFQVFLGKEHRQKAVRIISDMN